MFFLSCVNETIHLLGNLPFFKIHVNCFMARGESPCAILSQNACCERWAWYNTLCLRHSFIWLAACYQVYNALLKTSKGALFLSSFNVYVRSFPYLYYTLIKLCYAKSSKCSSLTSDPGSKSSPLEVMNRGVTHGSQQQPFIEHQNRQHWFGVESQCPWLAHIGIPCVHPLLLPLPALLVPVELAAGNMGGPCMTRRVDTMGWIQTL